MPIHGLLNVGPDPELLRIEVSSFLQLPSFQIIGLADPAVAEARERVRSAIQASGLPFPKRRVIVNLAPAYVRKRETGVDLPVALSVLQAGEEGKKGVSCLAWGELGLDGCVRPMGQCLRALAAAWSGGVPFVLISSTELKQAQEKLELLKQAQWRTTPPPRLIGVDSLQEAWDQLKREFPKAAPSIVYKPELKEIEHSPSLLPISAPLSRVLGIAASGQHHLLLIGPQGTGKTHAMEWLAALQPEASLEMLIQKALLEELRPFAQNQPFSVQPGQTTRIAGIPSRAQALTGSWHAGMLCPGEYSLAHGGLLLADEFPEWPRDARESLREPLEQGRITLTRVQGTCSLPARFRFAATANLCPCGGGSPLKSDLPGEPIGPRCRCTEAARAHYFKRLSGPILDRIDLTFQLHQRMHDPESELKSAREACAVLKERCSRSAERSHKQWGNVPGLLSRTALEDLLQENSRWEKSLRMILPREASLRSRHKLLRIALSLASWEECAAPTEQHFIEAEFYRPERHWKT